MYNSQFFQKLPMLGTIAAASVILTTPSGPTPMEDSKAPTFWNGLSHRDNVKRRHKRRIQSESRRKNRGR
jgi:hypothetical protein